MSGNSNGLDEIALALLVDYLTDHPGTQYFTNEVTDHQAELANSELRRRGVSSRVRALASEDLMELIDDLSGRE